MRTTLIVFLKEILDNLRDRRTLGTALIMGPIFGPVLVRVCHQPVDRALARGRERTMDLPVIGQQHAPNLVRYLDSRNIDVVDGPADRAAAIEAVKTGTHDVVLVIPQASASSLRTPCRPRSSWSPTRRTPTPSARRGARAARCMPTARSLRRSGCRRAASTRCAAADQCR